MFVFLDININEFYVILVLGVLNFCRFCGNIFWVLFFVLFLLGFSLGKNVVWEVVGFFEFVVSRFFWFWIVYLIFFYYIYLKSWCVVDC